MKINDVGRNSCEGGFSQTFIGETVAKYQLGPQLIIINPQRLYLMREVSCHLKVRGEAINQEQNTVLKSGGLTGHLRILQEFGATMV